MNLKKGIVTLGIIFLIVWGGFVVSAYFVVQKPLALQVMDHLLTLAWKLIVTSMLFINSLALGSITIRKIIRTDQEELSVLVLAAGIGLGEFGLLGFFLAAMGAAKFPILLGIQLILLVWFALRGTLSGIFLQIHKLIGEIIASGSRVPAWMKWIVISALALTGILTLLPPVEAFDALLYHLTVPALWLRDGGLAAYNIPHYWFPDLVEGAYLWGLGLGSDITTQQLHFIWAVASALLVWIWTRRLWGDRTAWWSLIFIVSMPSFLLLATWAYTDMALAFFAVSTLYLLWLGKERDETRWWILSAICAGMAMGVKYTSFIVPLTAVAMIAVWLFSDKGKWLTETLRYSLIAAVTGAAWYLRNWIWMGNPFYPFVFGGRYWDAFRSAWYAGSGTGAGWNLKELLALPFILTLGYKDVNSFDGDIGPLFLLILPVVIWRLARIRSMPQRQSRAVAVILLFAGMSASFWTYGYVTTQNLWQTRLLIPAIVPFALLAAIGMESVQTLDTKQLRVSFILTILVILASTANLLDMGLSTIARNPLALATGITSNESYMERYQPGYAYALQLVSNTPEDARIYFLFEPRSYGFSRNVQPDPILDNFSHAVYLYKNAGDIIGNWQSQGYTYILVNQRGMDFVLSSRESDNEIFNETLRLLEPVSESRDKEYVLYRIPRSN